MLTGNLIRRAIALGSALTAAGALVVITQQPASAASLTLYAAVDCTGSDNSGDTRDWYAWGIGVSSSPPSFSVGIPGTSTYANPPDHSLQFSQALPVGSTTAGVTAICTSGHQYDQVGWGNTGVSIPAGISNVAARWACYGRQVYPGPYITSCTVDPNSVYYW